MNEIIESIVNRVNHAKQKGKFNIWIELPRENQVERFLILDKLKEDYSIWEVCRGSFTQNSVEYKIAWNELTLINQTP